MRSRAFIITAAALTLLFAAVGGVYAYDDSGRDQIPMGVEIAGVAVGGLDASEARAKLEREYLPRLEAPVRVYHGKNTFTLTAEQSEVATDLGAVVDAAMAQADEGNMFSRSFRRVTGGTVEVDLAPEITFNRGRVVQYLDEIRQTIDRDPIDAKVEFAASGLRVREARVGLTVRASELHRKIRRAIVDPSADRTLVARTDHTPPKVGTGDIDKQYETAIVVDRASFRLRLYKSLELVETYPIAVGRVGRETPAGLYRIQNKAVNPAWTMPDSDWVAPEDRGKVIPGGVPENPLKSRWLGVYDGVGVHGTDDTASIGTQASQGCIRMRISDVEELYDEVPVGATIYIA